MRKFRQFMQYIKTEKEINDVRLEKSIECIKKACNMVHIIASAEMKTEKAQKVLISENKAEVWEVLQEYLREYAEFINSNTKLTGLLVYRVDLEYYEKATILSLKQQVKTVIAFVYYKEALVSSAKELFKQCLKKLLKGTGLFKEKELLLF